MSEKPVKYRVLVLNIQHKGPDGEGEYRENVKGEVVEFTEEYAQQFLGSEKGAEVYRTPCIGLVIDAEQQERRRQEILGGLGEMEGKIEVYKEMVGEKDKIIADLQKQIAEGKNPEPERLLKDTGEKEKRLRDISNLPTVKAIEVMAKKHKIVFPDNLTRKEQKRKYLMEQLSK